MRICLAASGGGHLRQLLDLEPAWASHDTFFVTERTALGESVAKEYRTHFVTHVALGQAKLGRPWLMIRSAWRNWIESGAAMRRERPDVIICTGAGAVFGALLWGKLYGAKVVAIETFARFDRPSAFMRIASKFSDELIVQSAPLQRWFQRAKVFDPLRMTTQPRPAKERLLFVTVGATLPFDRMVESVAELKRAGDIPEKVLAQVGIGGVQWPELECVETMSFDEMRSTLKRADLVVSHGGTGSLITALRERCRTVVMPRLFERGEHYDNHQLEISEAFEKRGLVRTARSTVELREALRAVRDIEPPGATTDPQQLIQWLQGKINGWEQIAHPRDERPMQSMTAAKSGRSGL
jgi:UDP-N-acetylglucosamine--N-acetylmuramyl-(pentapeptide) pyrophosphoryl-undecaprenol N-acetylglucosamine transferase